MGVRESSDAGRVDLSNKQNPALDRIPSSIPVPISEGGTGASTALQALINLGAPRFLGNLEDVDAPLTPGPSEDGYVLTWDDGTSAYILSPPSGGGGPTAFDDLSDVDVASPAANALVQFDGANWVDVSPASVAGDISLNDLSDAAVPSPGVDDILQYDGANWVATTPANLASDLVGLLDLDDLGDVNVGTPGVGEDGYVLQWDNTAGEFNLAAPSGGGGGVSGSGSAGQIAYWTGASTIAGEADFEWDATNNRLLLGGVSPTYGSLGLPNGVAGAIVWSANSGSDMGVHLEDVFGRDAYVWQWDGGTGGLDFTTAPSTASDVDWRFSSQGTGKGHIEVEGGIRIFNNNDFSGTVPPIDATTAIALPNGPLGSIKWDAASGADMGVHVGTHFGRDAYVWEQDGGTNGCDFAMNVTSGDREWRFSTTGSGKGSLSVEGYLEIYDASGFTGNVATSGTVRLPENPTITCADGLNTRTMLGFDGVANKVIIGGLQTSLWPATNGSGVLVNDGAGNLFWQSEGALDFDDLGDVNVASPVANALVQWNGSQWVDVAPSSAVSGVSIDDLSDVSSAGAAIDSLLQWSGSAWVDTPITTVAADIDFTNLGDVDISSPADDDILQYNSTSGEWENVPFSTFQSDITSTTDIEDLNNVGGAAPTNGQVLIWNNGAGEYQPGNVPAPATLSSIGDVNTAGITVGDSLFWNGSSWEDKSAIATGTTDTQMLFGVINSSGTIVSGTSSGGYTMTKLGVGQYRITFTSAFSNIASAAVTPGTIGANPDFRSAAATTFTSHVNVDTRDASNNYIDYSFSFIIIGQGGGGPF